jgi:TPR repeat protein
MRYQVAGLFFASIMMLPAQATETFPDCWPQPWDFDDYWEQEEYLYEVSTPYFWEECPALNTQSTESWQADAEQGDACAQYHVGFMYREGGFISDWSIQAFADDAEAAHWFRLAAEQGHAPAQNDLGELVAAGVETYSGDPEAVLWYQRAAEQSYADGQYNVALAFLSGWGIGYSDREEAECLIRRAALQGHDAADDMLQEWIDNGEVNP